MQLRLASGYICDKKSLGLLVQLSAVPGLDGTDIPWRGQPGQGLTLVDKPPRPWLKPAAESGYCARSSASVRVKILLDESVTKEYSKASKGLTEARAPVGRCFSSVMADAILADHAQHHPTGCIVDEMKCFWLCSGSKIYVR